MSKNHFKEMTDRIKYALRYGNCDWINIPIRQTMRQDTRKNKLVKENKPQEIKCWIDEIGL